MLMCVYCLPHIFPPFPHWQAHNSVESSTLHSLGPHTSVKKSSISCLTGFTGCRTNIRTWGHLFVGVGVRGQQCHSYCFSVQVQNASDLLIKPLEKFRKEQIGVTKVSILCLNRQHHSVADSLLDSLESFTSANDLMHKSGCDEHI